MISTSDSPNLTLLERIKRNNQKISTGSSGSTSWKKDFLHSKPTLSVNVSSDEEETEETASPRLLLDGKDEDLTEEDYPEDSCDIDDDMTILECAAQARRRSNESLTKKTKYSNVDAKDLFSALAGSVPVVPSINSTSSERTKNEDVELTEGTT